MLSNYDARAVAEVLGLVLLRASRPSSVSSVFIENAVESGLPRNALRHVAELIAGGDKAKASALERGIVPKQLSSVARKNCRLRRANERSASPGYLSMRAAPLVRMPKRASS